MLNKPEKKDNSLDSEQCCKSCTEHFLSGVCDCEGWNQCKEEYDAYLEQELGKLKRKYEITISDRTWIHKEILAVQDKLAKKDKEIAELKDESKRVIQLDLEKLEEIVWDTIQEVIQKNGYKASLEDVLFSLGMGSEIARAICGVKYGDVK